MATFKDPELSAADREAILKVNRRCNDLELARLKQSVNHAMDLMHKINQEDSTKIIDFRIIPDSIPNCIGCHITLELFVYAPANKESPNDNKLAIVG